MGKKKKDETGFSSVKTVDELLKNLNDKVTKLHNKKSEQVNYVYHYTRQDTILSLLKSKQWHLNSPKNMNDGLELKYNIDECYNNFYFASFMIDCEESIAMWSMYAQPWKDGIMIRIPIEKYKSWIKGSYKIYSLSDNKDITDVCNLSSYAVAYQKSDGELVCGEQHNNNMNNASSEINLVGYIKDYAWHYENEIRLRIDIKADLNIDKVALSIPDEIIDSFEFITGPRNDNELIEILRKEIDPKFDESRIKNSKFKNLLNWVYCDCCK